MDPDLESVPASKWPQRVTAVGYLLVAVIAVVSTIRGIHVPW